MIVNDEVPIESVCTYRTHYLHNHRHQEHVDTILILEIWYKVKRNPKAEFSSFPGQTKNYPRYILLVMSSGYQDNVTTCISTLSLSFLPLSTHDSGLHDLRLTARALRLPLPIIRMFRRRDLDIVLTVGSPWPARQTGR